MGISDRHILVPYLWIRPISSWVRFGVKNQKKVDNAVVFGLRGMHNHTHLGHVMGYVGIGGVFRWFGAFFGVRGPPEGGPRTRVLIENNPTTGVKTKEWHRRAFIEIETERTVDMVADFLTKNLDVAQFEYLRDWATGYSYLKAVLHH